MSPNVMIIQRGVWLQLLALSERHPTLILRVDVDSAHLLLLLLTDETHKTCAFQVCKFLFHLMGPS